MNAYYSSLGQYQQYAQYAQYGMHENVFDVYSLLTVKFKSWRSLDFRFQWPI
jgi:hypothetical protein